MIDDQHRQRKRHRRHADGAAVASPDEQREQGGDDHHRINEPGEFEAGGDENERSKGEVAQPAPLATEPQQNAHEPGQPGPQLAIDVEGRELSDGDGIGGGQQSDGHRHPASGK